MSREKKLAAAERLLRQFVSFIDDATVGEGSVLRSFQERTQYFSVEQEASLMAFLHGCVDVFLDSENWYLDEAEEILKRLDEISKSDISAEKKYKLARTLMQDGI